MIAALQNFRKRFRKRVAISDVAAALKKEYGKQSFYRLRQIKPVTKRKSLSHLSPETLKIALSVFCTHAELNKVHDLKCSPEDYRKQRAPFIKSKDLSGPYYISNFDTSNLLDAKNSSLADGEPNLWCPMAAKTTNRNIQQSDSGKLAYAVSIRNHRENENLKPASSARLTSQFLI